MNEYQRARKPEQKEERRLHILLTARTFLIEGGDARTMSLNELARMAGMAKSNLYRYFESREEVLLALLWLEWREWHGFFEASFETGAKSAPLEEIARKLAKTIAARPLLGQLTVLLPAVLEHNLSEEAILEFKRGSLAFFQEIAAALSAQSSALTRSGFAALLLDVVTLIAGLYPFSHPAENVLRAHEQPDLAPLAHDYEGDLERLILAVARSHRA